MPSATSAALLRRGDLQDRAAIQRLLRLAFDEERSDAQWSWRSEQAPSGPALIHVVEADGHVLGHLQHVGFDTWLDGQVRAVGHGGDTMVDPAAQGRGIMRTLVQGFLASPHGYALRMNFPTDAAASLMQRYGGGAHVGRMPQWVRWSDGAALLASRAQRQAVGGAGAGVSTVPGLAALLGLALRASHLAAEFPPSPRRLDIAPLDLAGPDATAIDDLDHRSAAWWRFHRRRDAAYLRWRWSDQPDGAWRALGARDRDGSLCGLVVFGLVDDHAAPGIPTGRIVDLVAPDQRSTSALVRAAAAGLEADGARIVTLDLVDPRPWSARACLGAGFLRRGVGPNVVIGRLIDDAADEVASLDHWFLTAGDTDLA